MHWDDTDQLNYPARAKILLFLILVLSPSNQPSQPTISILAFLPQASPFRTQSPVSVLGDSRPGCSWQEQKVKGFPSLAASSGIFSSLGDETLSQGKPLRLRMAKTACPGQTGSVPKPQLGWPVTLQLGSLGADGMKPRNEAEEGGLEVGPGSLLPTGPERPERHEILSPIPSGPKSLFPWKATKICGSGPPATWQCFPPPCSESSFLGGQVTDAAPLVGSERPVCPTSVLGLCRQRCL